MSEPTRTVAGIVNWFNATDRFTSTGRTVFAGPAPFGFNRRDADADKRLMENPWVISHSSVPKDTLWRCTGLELFAVQHIFEGMLIGLVVIPWVD